MGPPSYRLISESATDIGKVRAINEDSALERPGVGLFAVADGMGGHEGGDFASAVIVQQLADLDPPDDLDAAVDAVRGALHTANTIIYEAARSRGPGVVMGSTVTALTIRGARFACLWAGDSRLYRWRAGSLRQLTRDHTALEDMIAAGEPVSEHVAASPYAGSLTRAVGAFSHLDPELARGEVENGDVFLLCSDGLTRMIGDDEIARTLRENEARAEALIKAALDNGGRDNVTVIVVRAAAA